MGKVTLITGPMYSGKTSELLRYVRRAKLANKSTYIIKFAGDDRYSSGEVVTHDYVKDYAHPVDKDGLSSLQLEPYENIFVDEAQFFTNLRTFVSNWSLQNKNIYLAALNSNYLGEPWSEIINIGPVESYINLSAVCKNVVKMLILLNV